MPKKIDHITCHSFKSSIGSNIDRIHPVWRPVCGCPVRMPSTISTRNTTEMEFFTRQMTQTFIFKKIFRFHNFRHWMWRIQPTWRHLYVVAVVCNDYKPISFTLIIDSKKLSGLAVDTWGPFNIQPPLPPPSPLDLIQLAEGAGHPTARDTFCSSMSHLIDT